MIAIVITSAVFLLTFSVQNGWQLTNTERYTAAGVAATIAGAMAIAGVLSAGIASNGLNIGIRGIALDVAAVASVSAAGVIIPVFGPLSTAVAGVVSIVVIAGICLLVINKKLLNPLSIIFLILEGGVIFAVIFFCC